MSVYILWNNNVYVFGGVSDARMSLIGVGMVTVQESSGFSNLEKGRQNELANLHLFYVLVIFKF